MTGRYGDTLQCTSIHHSRKWDEEGTVGGGSGRPGGVETHSNVRPSTTQESGIKGKRRSVKISTVNVQFTKRVASYIIQIRMHY